jgi:hypothetical protein
MMRIMAWITTAFLFLSPAFAQNEPDVSLTLAIKGEGTGFRVGERIDVQLQFQSKRAGRYVVWTDHTNRTVRQSFFDHFILEPKEGVADPLQDIFEQREAIVGRPPAPKPLSEQPVIVDLTLNEWLSIRKPGRYQVTVETNRVVFSADQATAIPLRSNTVDINVYLPEPGWATKQLKEAVSVLELGDLPRPGIEQPYDPGKYETHNENAIRAAQTLRFLETPEAARAIVRFFEQGPDSAQRELNAGLFASPHRKEVMAAMEESLASPDMPVTYGYLAALMRLVQLVQIGPTPLYTAKTQEESKRWMVEVETPRREAVKPIEEEYFAKLAKSIKAKKGQALAVSLDTLITRGPQTASAATIGILLENFASLPELNQERLLTMDWPKLASPSLVPFLISIAKGRSPAADTALLRLLELDLEAGREIMIEQIRAGNFEPAGMYNSDKYLMLLPDKTLPELDAVFVTMLGKYDRRQSLLIARYASQNILRDIRDWFSAVPGCNWNVLAYLFKFDPAYAAMQVRNIRQAQWDSCGIHLSDPYLLMSPGLERQAIEDLFSTDSWSVVRLAQTALEKGGSRNAKEPLFEAMSRFHEETPMDDSDHGMEYGFVSALLKGNGWVPSSTDMDRVFVLCSKDDCRNRVENIRSTLVPPLAISFDLSINGLDYARVGPFTVGSPQQLENKISQFPKGTQFYLERYYEGTWYRENRMQSIQQMLTTHGMELVEAPPWPNSSAISR